MFREIKESFGHAIRHWENRCCGAERPATGGSLAGSPDGRLIFVHARIYQPARTRSGNVDCGKRLRPSE